MKFSSIPIVALLCSTCATEPTAESVQERSVEERDSTGTCSIGIARWFGSTKWDATIYNVPQVLRQDVNVIATLKNAQMDKGKSITVSGQNPPISVTITNVDNKEIFDYNTESLNASISDPATGITKVKLSFVLANGNRTWTTDDCYAASVVFSAGLEGWSCDFPCSIAAVQNREL